MSNLSQIVPTLPSTEQLLLLGGDVRITIDPDSGLNKYGCAPFPDPQLLAFGSSTASNISKEGYATANRLRESLLSALSCESPVLVYASEMQRLRLEWLESCELSGIAGLELIFSPSGTDIHAIVAQYASSNVSKPPLIIMVEANETGSGVVSALNVNSVTGNNKVEVVQVPIRLDDGRPRPLTEIDAEVEVLANKAVISDRSVLLILVDQSKTGLIAPSPACVIALQRRYPDHIDVLIDACQFRIGMPTLRAYLEQGFMVALTGSKFLTGPSFSAALLLPETVAERFHKRTSSAVLSSFSKAHRPDDWTESSEQSLNFGLLLRCAVALNELRRFQALPKTAVINFIKTFAKTIHQRLMADPYFESLPVMTLDRLPLIESTNWDHLQTIFPFLLYDPGPTGRIPLSREQTLKVYQQLSIKFDHPESDIALIRCQLGQSVACGSRNGIPVSALRLCLSSRLIVEAIEQGDQGVAIINDALNALDKTVLLIQSKDQKYRPVRLDYTKKHGIIRRPE